ncbi:MAG: DUF1404 family protein [Thermoplasmata archaeon]
MEGVSASRQDGSYELWGGILGLSLVLALVVLLPPVDSILEEHEGLHHLQHALTFGLSLISGTAAYGLLRTASINASGMVKRFSRGLLVANHRANPGGIPSLLFAAVLVVFWHIPYFFNLAVLDDFVHGLEHLCFLLAGGSVGIGLHQMNKWTRLGSLIIAELVMLLFSVLIVVFELHVYEVYPREHEFVFGIGMIYSMMPVMLYTVYRFLVEQVS